MSLRSVIEAMRREVTPATCTGNYGLPLKAAPALKVTPVIPVTREKRKIESDGGKRPEGSAGEDDLLESRDLYICEVTKVTGLPLNEIKASSGYPGFFDGVTGVTSQDAPFPGTDPAPLAPGTSHPTGGADSALPTDPAQAAQGTAPADDSELKSELPDDSPTRAAVWSGWTWHAGRMFPPGAWTPGQAEPDPAPASNPIPSPNHAATGGTGGGLVCCGNCGNFVRDRIGDGTGLGSCPTVNPPGLLWPGIVRRCPSFVATSTQGTEAAVMAAASNDNTKEAP